MLNFLCNLRGFLQQDLLARFCKESSLAKQEMLPDIGTRIFYKGGGFALWPHLSPLPMVFSPSGTTGRGALFRMMLTRSHGLGTAAREFGGEGGADHAAVAGLSWEAKTPCRASHRRGLLCEVWLISPLAPGRAGIRADGLRGGVGTTLPTMFSRERGSQWSRGLRRVFSLLLPLYPAE